jgi:hypothetical protein
MSMFRTKSGNHLGMAPYTIQIGDQIALFAGVNCPMVIRPQGEHFRLIAPAYVHGIIYGGKWPWR